jgi:hypothetical protein
MKLMGRGQEFFSLIMESDSPANSSHAEKFEVEVAHMVEMPSAVSRG